MAEEARLELATELFNVSRSPAVNLTAISQQLIVPRFNERFVLLRLPQRLARLGGIPSRRFFCLSALL